jgi:hypothetical protein
MTVVSKPAGSSIGRFSSSSSMPFLISSMVASPLIGAPMKWCHSLPSFENSTG